MMNLLTTLFLTILLMTGCGVEKSPEETDNNHLTPLPTPDPYPSY